MAFLNPFFLFGLLAAAIPLLIHLWNRRQAVTVDFSSLMFLVAAHRQNARRLQLKQLLILLLRMLIVALIALALARPFLTLGLPLAAVRAKTDVVIVLDNSYSMDYRDVDGVWFEKAKTLAIDVLRSLRHGDSASLILMSDIPQPIFRQLTPDVESVVAAIQNAEVSYRATNVQPSVELAHEILSESTQQNKELYLISDFAQNGWNNWEMIPNQSGSRIVLLPVSERIPHNTNIEEILPSHQLIGVDLPFHLNTTIRNYSDTPIAQTTLTFYVGDQKRKTQTFSATADESIVTTLTHTFSTPGTHTGFFELTDDRLNVDNRRYFALEALGEIRVLCVGDQTEYLKLVLNPLVSKQTTEAPAQSSMIQPTACTPVEFETFPLEEYDVILLADVPKISPKAGAQLREFVRQGKSIIVFGTTNYNLSWIPAQFGQPIIWQIPQQVSKYEESHPIFEIFSENILSGQYGPQFYQSMTVTPAPDATVIARFGDDTPFLIERRDGKNHILFFNCGLQQQSNNELLVNPYFLPLLQHSVLYVMRSNTQKNINVGEAYTASYPQNSGGRAWIKRLESSDENAMTAVPISEDGSLRFESTELPGIYQVDVKAQDRLFRDFFAVNTSTAEADLTSIPLQQASERVNAQAGSTNETGKLDTEALDIQRHGREIWGELLILAVCLLLLEGFLSNRASTFTAGEA
ncbi:MAG: BatA domain-containing protein [Candidatus Poribacteria bacterium]|nr:BatA domain-containing protein [Candidatus Poribacteria bacterium]